MTPKQITELEKQFFDTFGIEPKKIYLCPRCKTKLSGCTWVGDKQRFECLYSWGEHPYYMGKEVEEKAIIDYEYPQITDRHYLELYCTLCDAFNILHVYQHPAFTFRVKDFKECVLKDLIMVNTFYKSEYVKHQVQVIFEDRK